MVLGSIEQMQEEILIDPFFGNAISFALNQLGEIKDKTILDSGCGIGKMSVFFALKDAKIIGIDKCSKRIKKARDLATSYDVQDNCLFLHGSSEETDIQSSSIDIIFSKSTIQYMDRKRVINEYIRVLKPDGQLVLIENLPYNPFINLYRIHRKLSARTQQERNYVESIQGYITTYDINSLKTFFHFFECRQYHFFRMISIYLKLHLTSKRAWVEHLDSLLSYIDRILLDMLPFLRLFAWFTVVYCSKKRT